MRKFTLLIILLLAGSQLYAQFVRKSVRFEGTDRIYLVYLPSGYNGETNLPLVINMHGFGSNATEQAVYSRFNNLADIHRFIAVYPEGLVATLPELGTGQHWNAYFQSGVNDTGFLDLMIDLIWNEYSIDPTRVYATGMSNGGFMAITLACELSDRIAAVSSVTGTMVEQAFNSCQPERPVPLLQFHGTEDLIVPYDGSELLASVADLQDFWKSLINCTGSPTVTELPDTDPEDNSTVTRYLYSDCDQNTEVDFYIVNGGGHTWPGALIEQPQLGTTNKDINASTLIWEFFSQYTHPNPREPQVITSADPQITAAVYPTILSNHLNVNTTQATNLEIFTLSGSRVFEHHFISGASEQINTSEWHSGLYIARLTNASGTSVLRLVKK